MRKNRTKHEAKKPRLAKRALALCFALIFVCSCLLPAFANSGENQLTDLAQETVVEPQQDEQQPEELSLLNESGENPTVDNTDSTGSNTDSTGSGTNPTEEPKPAEQEPKADEPKNEEPKTEETKNEGTTESKDSAEQQGNEQTKPEEPKTEGTTESKDSTEEQPKNEGTTEETKPEETKPEGTTEEPKTEETKPEEPKQPTTNTTGDTIEQGKATYTYRFWPDKIDAFDLEAINDDVKSGTSLNDAAQSRVKMVPCTVLTVMTNANLRDYQANVQQPTKSGYEFAGWYTVDGTTEDEFSFDQNVNFEESKTIDVFAKWEKVESTVEDEMEKTEPTTEDKLDKTESGTESGKANESKEETLLPVEGEVGLTNNKGDTVSIAVKAENLPGKVKELVVTNLNEDDDAFDAFESAFGASDYKDWTPTNLMVNITPKDAEGNTVEPNEAVTVHFSGLESLMIQYSSEMDLKVLHMKRDGTLEALSLKNIQTKETQEGTVLSSFAVSTTSFSPFVLAASESASVEPARLDVGKYPTGDEYTHKDGIYSYRQITVGESIVVSCGSDHWIGSHTWSSDNTSVIEIVSSDANTVRIKAVGEGTATISHGHLLDGYTFYVAQSRGTEKASIFFLNKPNADKDSNQWGEWLPSNGNYSWQVNATDMDGTINTTHAKWSVGDSNAQNKNILLHDTDNETRQYVTEWPDGAKTKAWTLYNQQLIKTQPTEYTGTNWSLNNAVFTDVLGKMWIGYQDYLKTQLGVTDLTLEEAEKKITQITLTPYKISNNNDGMHIDCEIGVTGISYEAKFWVKAPGKTVYEQAYGKAYKDADIIAAEPTGSELRSWKNAHSGSTVTLNPDGSLPGSITGENGVSYTLKKWYEEDGDQPSQTKASFPHTPTIAEKYDGVVNFYAEYVADDKGKLDQNPYIAVEKQIIGLPSAKVDELLKTFKVNVGGFVLNSSNYGFTKKTNGDETILRWKIDQASAGSYYVTESGYDVGGYNVTTSGDINTTVYVEDENAAFTATAERITEQNSKDFKVGERDGQYWVFVASLTKASKNVVISNRTLSAKERASIVKAVNQLKGTIGNQSTLDFYSVAENQEITIKDDGREYKITYKNYNEKVHGPGIHIEAESMWNMVASVNYTMDNAKSADIKLTNTYTPATTSLTVTKETRKDGAEDHSNNKDFEFTLTLGEKSLGATWTKGAESGTINKTTHKFTLKGGESIIFSGIRLDDTNVKVEEIINDNHYTTTNIVDSTASPEGKVANVTPKSDGNTVVFTNEYTTPKLPSMTIKKVVTGAFGERTKEFAFSVTLTKDGAKVTGVIHTSEYGANVTNLDNFKLKHGQQVTLKDIPVGTTITVTETDANEYKTSAVGHSRPVTGSNDRIFVYEVVEHNGEAALVTKTKVFGVFEQDKAVANNAIVVTNNFDGTPDTGVLLDTLPYLILLAVAVAGGVLVVVRKRKHRDE